MSAQRPARAVLRPCRGAPLARWWLLWLGPVAWAWGESVTIPVYGVLTPAGLDPQPAAWFLAHQPQVFQTLHVGTVEITVAAGTSASQSQAFAGCAVYHATLQGQCQATAGGYTLGALLVSRIERVDAPSGVLTTTVLVDPVAPGTLLTASSQTLLAYAILPPLVGSVVLGDGFGFPAAADAANFRWHVPGRRMRGQRDGDLLSAGGAQLMPWAQAASTALASYQGAYVQLRAADSGAYCYVPQDRITLDDPSTYDPVALDGMLLLGGSLQRGASTQARVQYPLGVMLSGSCLLSDALATSALPSALEPAAAASELAPATAGPPAQVVTTQHRGTVPVLDSAGTPTGATVRFYSAGPDAAQSTVQVLSDIDAQRANSVASQPLDTQADSAHPDRITTPVTGSRTSGLNQLQAQAQAAQWSYAPAATPSAGDTSAVLPTATATADATASGSTTLSAAALLALSDATLDDQLSTTYSAQGVAQPAQRTPLVIAAQGTISSAQAAGASDATVEQVDRINQVMAPHMEATQWPGGLPPRHHQALIHPIDYLDAALCAACAPATGVTIPDQAGDPVPGDGQNPVQPLPQGCQAGHPCYDLDGDGSLDRWFSDDPFQGGYRALKLLWCGQPAGTYQLGDFTVTPSYNLCIVGVTPPHLADDGTYQTREDLLLTIGHSFRPFSHASLHRLSYQTFYGSGFITPLDPLPGGDPTLYQLALTQIATLPSAAAAAPADGVPASSLVPVVVSGVQPVLRDLTGGGVPRAYTLCFTVDFYDGLASLIQSPPWSWQWSQPGFTLPTGVVDHPGSPAVVHATLQDAQGQVVQSQLVSRPQYVDPAGLASGPFDPSLLPVAATAAPASQTPATDTYQWAYPHEASSAEGGVQVADPAHWSFPWNLCWTDDPHSRNQSSQGFTLDSADLTRFPAYQGQTPLISQASLVASHTGGGPIQVQWLLRENPATAPSGDVAAWANGQELYTASTWRPGLPWMLPGRATGHVLPWQVLSDIFGPQRSQVGDVRCASGMRLYELLGGYATYTFRGASITCTTRDQQIALLRRMWNYDLTGYEEPPPNTTTLPSLCIPQRLDNRDPTSPLLNTCLLPPASAASEVTTTPGDAGQGGDLAGGLVADLATAATPRLRAQAQRRLRLMDSQIFLFSAARGREWELQMARRMPSSVRLVCVEYDNRQQVQAVLGVHGGNVVFPTITATTTTDALGGRHTVETSTELQILKEVAQQWFDSGAPVVSYQAGRMQVGADTALHATTIGSGVSARGGSATTIDTSAVDAFSGFACMLPEGIPAGFACYAYPLRCLPASPRQWTSDPGQALLQGYQIEFRHPMLILYHDAASSVYVHYGRNADPDQVFGAWDACAPPPADMPVTTPEFARRRRFDAYATSAQLTQLYDQLHPDQAQLGLLTLLSMPPAPPDPGAPPAAVASVPYPGLAPQAPQLTLPDWNAPGTPATAQVFTTVPVPAALDGYDAAQAWTPWQGDPGYAHETPLEQWQQYLGATPEFDLTRTGWLRLPLSAPDGAGEPLGPPSLWQAGQGEDYEPIGGANSGCSSLLYGQVAAPVVVASSHSDNAVSFCPLAPDLTAGSPSLVLSWDGADRGTIPAGPTVALASNDDVGSGQMWYLDRQGAQSYAGISHPLSLRYYQAYAVLPIMQAYQAIYLSRSLAISTFTAQEAAYQQQLPQWSAASAAYAQMLAAQDAYPAEQAAYQQAEEAWIQWNQESSALAASQAAAAAYQHDRQDWVSAVLAQIQAQPVSWTGDPGLTHTTLAQIQAIQPQLPIWQAYAWFIDPVQAISAATANPGPDAGP